MHDLSSLHCREPLTPALFHGAESEPLARTFASRLGEVVWEGVLTTESARRVVEMGQEGSLMGRRVWISGPVDEASHAAVDVLLKLLEEGEGLDAVLWGVDELEIPATLRSRCHLKWCGGFGRVGPLVGLPDLEAVREDPRAVLEGIAARLWRNPQHFDADVWREIRKGLLRKAPMVWDVGAVLRQVWGG